MGLPYKVVVSLKSNTDVNVKITPQPIATKENYLPIVTARFQGIVVEHSPTANTMFGRSRLKKALIEALTDFHSQNMIEPKRDDEPSTAPGIPSAKRKR